MDQEISENLDLIRNKLRQLKEQLSDIENYVEREKFLVQVRFIEKVVLDCQFKIDDRFSQYVKPEIRVTEMNVGNYKPKFKRKKVL